MKLVKKSAMVVIRDNKLLVVRKKGSRYYLMPGGKPEKGESAVDALRRELREEISCSVDDASLTLLGHFEDFTQVAARRLCPVEQSSTWASDGKSRVAIDLFAGGIVGEPKPSSEIEELKWISAADSINPFLTPIVKTQIMPFLVGKGMLR